MFHEELQECPGGLLNVAIGPTHGPPLVCLHGVTRRWQCLLPVIAPLAARWQIAAIDLPGHGDSRASCEPFTVLAYADLVHEWLVRSFDRPVILFGHSLGAMLAAELAGREGSPVAAVILEDPPFETMGRRIGETPLLSYFEGVRDIVRQGPGPVAAKADALGRLPITDPASGRVTLLGETRSPAGLRFMAACLARLTPQVLDPIVASTWLDGYDLETIASRLTVPTLLLQADPRQGGMLSADDARVLVERGRDVTLTKRDGLGHQMHWAEPDWLVGEVMLFLESLPR